MCVWFYIDASIQLYSTLTHRASSKLRYYLKRYFNNIYVIIRRHNAWHWRNGNRNGNGILHAGLDEFQHYRCWSFRAVQRYTLLVLISIQFSIYSYFVEEGVTHTLFEHLSETEQKELIPKLVDRLNFRKGLAEFRKLNEPVQHLQVMDEPEKQTDGRVLAMVYILQYIILYAFF